MKMTTIELKKIIASSGKVLTDGEAFGKVVYLGINDNAENWREITDAEYAEIVAKQQADMDNFTVPESDIPAD